MAETSKVVRFNWPKYLGALGLVCAVVSFHGLFGPVAWPLSMAALLAAVWTLTSLGATWLVYDRHGVYQQLTDGLGPIGEWASVHAGFDDATPILTSQIGHLPAAVMSHQVDAGASLRRARRMQGSNPTQQEIRGSLRAGSLDTIFVTFAAHEIRKVDEQRGFFRLISNALKPDGRMILSEHHRDLPNFAAYGPGAFHFRCAATWDRRSTEAGLSLVGDTSIGCLVHRTVWTKA